MFPTVSSRDGFSLEPFHELHRYSRGCWPTVFSQMCPITVGGASLLFELRGSDPSLEPLLLTAHQDVVPADADDGWDHPPFGGIVENGVIHGRGALDFKCGYAGILEACETLLKQGFRPGRTLYLAMGHDEEIGGAAGAEGITRLLEDRAVMCAFALDEGGYIHTLPWSGRRAALIGIAEKGYATFSVKAEAEQGHASVPTSVTAAGLLAGAVMCIENNPFPLDPPPGIMPLFESAGLEKVAATPYGSALTRTTATVTVIRSGEKENVLPASGSMLVNCRIIPGESVASVEKRLSDELSRIGLVVTLQRNESLSEPSEVSSAESDEYRVVRDAAQVYCDGIPILPGMFVAATDSRHYSRVARSVYRFLPVKLDGRGVGMLHSRNEAVTVADYHACVGFYREVVRRFC
ncbi:MAG: M20/M25/M40 family metallo-hydrolase [Candidatus Fermentibacteraceae bacterium]